MRAVVRDAGRAGEQFEPRTSSNSSRRARKNRHGELSATTALIGGFGHVSTSLIYLMCGSLQGWQLPKDVIGTK